ncbi:bifunctional alpha/beta hydrolase/OsmC family protein [Glacieibacterium megasporae]|uniref:bifunctional alpha/beta hydrolase/OsmC family protein n=1 Tax=Glacieibacterium megasporae TaxID=2835787 RepID=UPI001C1E89E7|nr:bifunctional alpha/beta hydrolase/OsmC family protein [Polymorphobacter megasporae]UAJ11016.1 bifunctional alpha/beta hydrolase/OsmC family protein [Polymorphobacter megasporae]
MASTEFAFTNDAGIALAGILETGNVPVRAYAVFAHCFTCDKTSLAAVKVSRRLAQDGIGVLRFDFTGLGESEGEFGRGLSGDVKDIVSAVAAMAGAGMAPQLLIGHSFGGAAVLAAAGALGDVKAVAVIGAPFDARHILTHLGDALIDVSGDDRIPVSIGGREFLLGSDFVDDIRAQRQHSRIAELGRALLILHSPLDEVVSITNASEIFQAARHPKSFVSLDHADHLLRQGRDAVYAAEVIGAWSRRYLDIAVTQPVPPVRGLRVEETGIGKFQVRVVSRSGSFLVDEPTSVGGLASGPSPYDLIAAGLGACTAMTCRMYADRKGWPLERTIVEVGHTGRTVTSRETFTRRLGFEGRIDAAQEELLLEIADRCPVHRTLTEGAVVETSRIVGERDDGAPDIPDDHARQVAEACTDADTQ